MSGTGEDRHQQTTTIQTSQTLNDMNPNDNNNDSTMSSKISGAACMYVCACMRVW